MTKAISVKINEYQKTIFWVLFGLLTSLIFSYGYFTAQSIIDVAERRRVEMEIAELRSQAVELELSYIVKENEITMDLAYNMGYLPADEPQFVSRAIPVASR